MTSDTPTGCRSTWRRTEGPRGGGMEHDATHLEIYVALTVYDGLGLKATTLIEGRCWLCKTANSPREITTLAGSIAEHKQVNMYSTGKQEIAIKSVSVFSS